MSEEFAVDGSLGYGATVDGKVSLPAPGTVVVDYAWYDFLSHSALTDYQHAEVSRCHLQSHVKGMVQGIAVAHDVVSLFNIL